MKTFCRYLFLLAVATTAVFSQDKSQSKTLRAGIVGLDTSHVPAFDVVFLESVDGRIHFQEVREIFKSGKPVFIDKPGGGNLPESLPFSNSRKNIGNLIRILCAPSIS